MMLPKIDIKKILFPTDLSQSSLHAFAYAVSLADRYGSEIIILHVLTKEPQQEGIIKTVISEDQWNEIKQRQYEEARDQLIGKKGAHNAMKDVLQTFADNLKTESGSPDIITDEIIIGHGEPVETILMTADQRNCDLIVMGSHGQGGIVKAFIGSTARRVVRRSKKPVLVVRLSE